MKINSSARRDSIYGVVSTCVAEANSQGLSRIPLDKGDAANILSGGRYIDSLGVVSLLIMIEQDLEDELGVTLEVGTTVAQAATNGENPLATVGTLIDHISQQLSAS